MSWLAILLDVQVLAIGIPAAGLILAVLVTLLRSSLAHRERMAMIHRGLHPDDPRARLSPREEELTV